MTTAFNVVCFEKAQFRSGEMEIVQAYPPTQTKNGMLQSKTVTIA